MEKSVNEDKWTVFGRGVLHLSILMRDDARREGYELQVGQPQVIIREIDGKKCEPIEALSINVPGRIFIEGRGYGHPPPRDIALSMDTRNDRIDIEFPYTLARHHRLAQQCN